MANKNITERNLTTIIIFVLAIILLAAILYNFSFLFKQPDIDYQKAIKLKNDEEKAKKSDEEYKRIIEKSKLEYEEFMKQRKNPY